MVLKIHTKLRARFLNGALKLDISPLFTAFLFWMSTFSYLFVPLSGDVIITTLKAQY